VRIEQENANCGDKAEQHEQDNDSGQEVEGGQTENSSTDSIP